jgi:hypothetical protein
MVCSFNNTSILYPHELVLVDELLSFSQDGHKGNGQEWSLGSVVICLVLKIEKSESGIGMFALCHGTKISYKSSALF